MPDASQTGSLTCVVDLGRLGNDDATFDKKSAPWTKPDRMGLPKRAKPSVGDKETFPRYPDSFHIYALLSPKAPLGEGHHVQFSINWISRCGTVDPDNFTRRWLRRCLRAPSDQMDDNLYGNLASCKYKRRGTK
jgi:hypothetical protein